MTEHEHDDEQHDPDYHVGPGEESSASLTDKPTFDLSSAFYGTFEMHEFKDDGERVPPHIEVKHGDDVVYSTDIDWTITFEFTLTPWQWVMAWSRAIWQRKGDG